MDNCNKCKPKNCGCKDAHVCGCDIKLDLLCAFYSGKDLEPLGITQGMDGNTVIEIINDFLQQIDLDPTVIKNVGNGVKLYKGLSDEYKHEIKTLVQGEGITITEQDDTITITSSATGGSLERDVKSTVNEGNITAGQVLPKGMTFTKFVEEFLLKTFYPDLIPPSAILKINESDREIGESYSFTGTLEFKRGEIKGALVNGVWEQGATQNPRSGVATNYNITGTNLGLVNSKTITGTTVLGDNIFSGYVDYADSNIQPTDSTGQPYDDPLMQGRVSASNSFEGKYKIFYGASGPNVTDFRSLPKNQLVKGTTNFTLNTGTTYMDYYIAIPSSYSLQDIFDQDALNTNVKESFKLLPDNQVPDAGGTPRPYKIYRWHNAKPYDTDHRLNAKIG